MERLQANEFELRPTGAQRRLMRRFAGSRRFVHGGALAPQQVRCADVNENSGTSRIESVP